MSDYTTYVGHAKRRTPVETYEKLLSLPTVERQDDGAVVLHVGHSGAYLYVDGGPGPVCSDCGRGVLRWAEAGYVAWWRICDVCGSHWDLHPITWGPAKPQSPVVEQVGWRCGHNVAAMWPQWIRTASGAMSARTSQRPCIASCRCKSYAGSRAAARSRWTRPSRYTTAVARGAICWLWLRQSIGKRQRLIVSRIAAWLS